METETRWDDIVTGRSDLKPSHVVDEIRRQRENAADLVRFHWAVVGGGSRDDFAKQVRDLAAPLPVPTLVVRTSGFNNADTVMCDLAAVLEAGRLELEGDGMRQRMVESGHADVLLVSRRELAMAPASSSLVLPSWFPILAGKEVPTRIADLTWTASIALAAPEVRIGDIRRLLHDLDAALVDRASAVGTADQRVVRDLVDQWNGITAETWDPVWHATAATHADGLPKLAERLAKALQVGPQDVKRHTESIATVLTGAGASIGDRAARWALDVLATAEAARRLAASAAWAGEYGLYPVHLLVSLSRDLRRALDGFVELLERLE